MRQELQTSLKVIVLNGPPRSGKDTLVKLLRIRYPYSFIQTRFSEPVKRAVHSLLGIGIHTFADPDKYDAVKDEAVDDFFGHVPRPIYIEMSEKFAKPLFGDQIFGKVWLRLYEERQVSFEGRCVVITDCGFFEEMVPLLNYFQPGELALVKLHRAGYTFKDDSREYINLLNSPHHLHSYNLENPEGEPEKMISVMEDILSVYPKKEVAAE